MRRPLHASLALTLGLAVQGSLAVQNPQNDPRTVRVGFLKPGGGHNITTMPLETYVARVLAGEAVRDSQPSALEALAITVRTFALANLNRHQADGFDLCDQTHCQVLRASVAATERAAQITAGRVLLRNGQPASVFYTASCGGRSEIPSAVWPGAEDPPFLPSRDDDACEGAPAWTASINQVDLLRAFRAGGFGGDRLRGVTVVSRDASGRVAQLRLDGLQPDHVSGQDLRVIVGRTLGWQHVKSTAFELQRRGDLYRFSGHGSGHGVGLCVIGSARLAEHGITPEQILARYFPGLAISGLSTPNSPVSDASKTLPSGTAAVVVSLPDGDEGERSAIVRATIRARDELARTLGIATPTRVTLRFHPTTDDYEKVTGQPWFTSGTLINGEVHVLPLATLRDRGVLDRTIRHELVHVMTDATLEKRPAWVREGAAIYFAGEQPAPAAAAQRPAFKPQPRAACPSDTELRQPVSVGALVNAYSRARTCFAKQIQAGKNWKDVR